MTSKHDTFLEATRNRERTERTKRENALTAQTNSILTNAACWIFDNTAHDPENATDDEVRDAIIDTADYCSDLAALVFTAMSGGYLHESDEDRLLDIIASAAREMLAEQV